jgi:uncharacterized membrane protein
VSCGAAIALVGQIFNMQEHWPAAVMLWAICAAAGWWLLGDEFQQTATLLLVPAWLVCEWGDRASVYDGPNVYLGRMIAVIAAVYLTAFLHSRRRVMFGMLFAVGGVALIVTTVILSQGWVWNGYRHEWGAVPVSLQIWSYAILLLTLAFAWRLDTRSVLPAVAVGATSFALPWLHTVVSSGTAPYIWRHAEPMAALYALVAALCVFLAWWGVREGSKAVVNYGIAAFALTVIWFYFSDIMGKLDRSLGLIVLGVLFLAGGWALEKMRRRLVGHITEVSA